MRSLRRQNRERKLLSFFKNHNGCYKKLLEFVEAEETPTTAQLNKIAELGGVTTEHARIIFFIMRVMKRKGGAIDPPENPEKKVKTSEEKHAMYVESVKVFKRNYPATYDTFKTILERGETLKDAKNKDLLKDHEHLSESTLVNKLHLMKRYWQDVEANDEEDSEDEDVEEELDEEEREDEDDYGLDDNEPEDPSQPSTSGPPRMIRYDDYSESPERSSTERQNQSSLRRSEQGRSGGWQMDESRMIVGDLGMHRRSAVDQGTNQDDVSSGAARQQSFRNSGTKRRHERDTEENPKRLTSQEKIKTINELKTSFKAIGDFLSELTEEDMVELSPVFEVDLIAFKKALEDGNRSLTSGTAETVKVAKTLVEQNGRKETGTQTNPETRADPETRSVAVQVTLLPDLQPEALKQEPENYLDNSEGNQQLQHELPTTSTAARQTAPRTPIEERPRVVKEEEEDN